MPYPNEGTLTTDTREVSISETWDTQGEWEAYQSIDGIEIIDGILQLQETNIPQSESDDKLIHRWYLSEESDPFVDQISNADGTNSGTTQVMGDWVDDAAREGDGVDDFIGTSTLDTLTQSIDTDFAVAFSVETSTTSSGAYMGTQEIGFSAQHGFRESDGNISFSVIDNAGNSIEESTTAGVVNDGSPHRVILNKTSNSASGLEIYVDKSAESTTNFNNNTISSTGTQSYEYPFFGRRLSDGSVDRHSDMILDDICIFNDSLTQQEIESYVYPWA